MNNKKLLSTRNMSIIAILSAMATILLYFDFPIPFLPPFYKLDFSSIPALIGGFAIGPMAAVVIVVLKIILNLLIQGSNSAFVGQIADFVLSIAFIFPSVLYYHHKKNKKGAIIGLLLGVLSLCVFGGIFNYYFLIPAYSTLYKMPIETIIQMGTVVFPFINDKFTFVLFVTSIFNIIKGLLLSIITLSIYKQISIIIKRVK